MTGGMVGPVICPVVVGRARDLESLHAVLDRVCRGRGQTVLLSGEAGVGKSRLVAEAKAYAVAHDVLSLQGNCFQPDVVCPYAPLLDLVRAHFVGHAIAPLPAEGQRIARELARRLPYVASRARDAQGEATELLQLEPQQEKRGLFRTLEESFLALAAHGPLLLIVEDLHWSDDISLEFLLYLARRIAAQPVLLLLTYRSDEVRPELSHFLAELDRERLAAENALPRLSMDEVHTMLRAMLGRERPVRAEFLQAIYTLTDGNPFFVEETLRALTSGGDDDPTVAWDRKPVYQLRIPRSVQDAIRRRLQQLSPAAVEVVSLAAVVGRRFDFSLLQQLLQCDEDELLRLVKELIGAQLVVEESAEIFAFRHALTREFVYFTLLARERKILHRTTAETLERSYADALEAHVAELAYHFYHAGMWQQVLLYAQRAPGSRRKRSTRRTPRSNTSPGRWRRRSNCRWRRRRTCCEHAGKPMKPWATSNGRRQTSIRHCRSRVRAAIRGRNGRRSSISACCGPPVIIRGLASNFDARSISRGPCRTRLSSRAV